MHTNIHYTCSIPFFTGDFHWEMQVAAEYKIKERAGFLRLFAIQDYRLYFRSVIILITSASADSTATACHSIRLESSAVLGISGSPASI
jgi:hypothetical protein